MTRLTARRIWPNRLALTPNWTLYVMALPGVLAIVVFGILPLFGLSLAFLDWSPVRGFTRSEFVGLEHFQDAFANRFFWVALQNTVIIKALQTVIGFPAAIGLALLLNEVRVRWFKSLVQTATLLPFFVSWIVIAAMFRSILDPTQGVLNEVLGYFFGFSEPVVVLSDPERFRWFIVFQDTWRFAGFFALIYLAAMSRIDPQLYEAAQVDGASRLRQTWHITLPGIRLTIMTMFVLLIGYLLIGSFEQVWAQYSPSVYSTGDIVETLTYRLGLGQGDYGFATAIGLIQGIMALALVVSANLLLRRTDDKGVL